MNQALEMARVAYQALDMQGIKWEDSFSTTDELIFR